MCDDIPGKWQARRAQRIRAVGAGVSDLRPGDRVAAFMVPPRFGGYADVVTVRADLALSLDALPDARHLTLEAAAVSIVNATTAFLAVTDVAGVKAGHAVLVHGGTGALGSMLGQLSRHLGASPVIATVGHAEKIPFALDLGYTHATQRGEFAAFARDVTHGRGLDIIFDTVGGAARSESLVVMSPLGRLILLGNSSGADDASVSLNSVWLESKGILGLNLGAVSVANPAPFHTAASEALTLVARGVLRAEASAILPLAEAAEAHRRLESGRTTGTLLLAAAAADPGFR